MSSKNNKCKSKCIPPNTLVIDPITLTVLLPKTTVCFVDPYFDNDQIEQLIECDNDNNVSTDIKNDPYLSSITAPDINFNYETFLRVTYNIKSFEESIKWGYNNLHLPRRTFDRVFNCSFYVYMDEVKHLMTELTNILTLYIKTYSNSGKKMEESTIRQYIKDSIKMLMSEYHKEMDISYIKKIRKYFKFYITKNI